MSYILRHIPRPFRIAVCMVSVIGAANGGGIEAMTSLIDNDVQPESTPGPGAITGGEIAMVSTFVLPRSRRITWYELEDPLFEELQGSTPGPDKFLYWTSVCDDELGRLRPWLQANAKRFGFRYVFEEQLQEAVRYKLLCGGRITPAYRRHGIATWRSIIGDPGEAAVPRIGGMPAVFGPQGWFTDPRLLREYVRRAVARAQAGEQWGLWAGDETWEVFAINAVPKDKRYAEVVAADSEIREKYGFGRHGMPDGNDDTDPFARIAYRRWVSDKMTGLFKEAYQQVKAVAPETAMLSPDFCSGVPAADVEAWTPWFDVFLAQCGNAPQPFPLRFAVGCDTKVMVDLCGKPVWMTVQNATEPDLDWRVPPEDVLERYSQVFRNGGHGIFVLASEWYERGLSHPKYAEPAKWRAMLHVIDVAARMNLPRLPEPDCAILYSSASLLTRRWAQMTSDCDREYYCLYTALGPLLRSWFHFVSDRQIERGIRDLKEYKVLYVPYAEYEDRAVMERIADYVVSGGTVVCTDPEAFTWDVSGENISAEWDRISGVKRAGTVEGDLTMTTSEPNPLPLAHPVTLTLAGPRRQLVPDSDSVEIVAAFADGAPAVTLGKHGAGRVVMFAAEAFAVRSNDSLVSPGAPVLELMAALQKASGAKLGHDIWRFKLPPLPPDVYAKERGRCLTGNYVFDRNDPLLEESNLRLAGSYTYSRLPTGLSDAGNAAEAIPFRQGHLTNRPRAYETRQKGFKWDLKDTAEYAREWAVSWEDPTPVSITFDLSAEHPLDRARLFYSGTMPALRVAASRSGENWESLAAVPEETAAGDVKDVTLPLNRGGSNYRRIRFDFGKRTTGDRFELCEVEIWCPAAR